MFLGLRFWSGKVIRGSGPTSLRAVLAEERARAVLPSLRENEGSCFAHPLRWIAIDGIALPPREHHIRATTAALGTVSVHRAA